MRSIIITGASGQLGRVVADQFLSKGYRVIGTSHSSPNGSSEHPDLEIHGVDLSDEKAAADFVSSAIKKHGQISAGLMLAGGFTMGDLLSTRSDDIKKQIQLNFDTAYHVARPLFQHMTEQGHGRLVFIGARPALNAAAGKNMVAYGLSKSLLFKLAEYMNAAGAEKNITATVIVPSTIDTRSNRHAMPGADLSKWVSPTDLAYLMEFILSDPAAALRDTVLKAYGSSE